MSCVHYIHKSVCVCMYYVLFVIGVCVCACIRICMHASVGVVHFVECVLWPVRYWLCCVTSLFGELCCVVSQLQYLCDPS